MSPCSPDRALRVLLFGSRDGWGQKGDRPSPLGDAGQCPLEARSSQGGRPVKGGPRQWALVQGRLVRPRDPERVSGHDGDPGHDLALPVPVLGKRVMPGIEPCISLGSSRHSRPQQSGEDRLQAGDLRLRVEVAGGGQVTGHLASIRAMVPSARVFSSPPAGSHSLPRGNRPTRQAGYKLGSLGVLAPKTCPRHMGKRKFTMGPRTAWQTSALLRSSFYLGPVVALTCGHAVCKPASRPARNIKPSPVQPPLVSGSRNIQIPLTWFCLSK